MGSDGMMGRIGPFGLLIFLLVVLGIAAPGLSGQRNLT